MTALVDLYGGADVYVPDFEIRVDNRDILREVSQDVIDVSYHDQFRQLDTFQFTLNNWDDEKQKYKHSDGDLFLPGSSVELRIGYRGKIGLHVVIRGRIASLTPNFPASGPPTLRVSGQNALRELATRPRSEHYTDQTDSEIARTIADRLDVDLEPPDTAQFGEKRYRDLVQKNEYDVVFLMRRARTLGYELFVEEDERRRRLRYAPSTAARPGSYRLGYLLTKQGRALIEFNPRFSTDRQVERVELRSWDRTNKRPIVESARRDDADVDDPDFDRETIRRASRGRTEVISDEPAEDGEEARDRAARAMGEIKRETMTASGRTVGLPDLRAGSVVEINGVGERFSGRWFVTATRHRLGTSGYTTGFDCRREEVR